MPRQPLLQETRRTPQECVDRNNYSKNKQVVAFGRTPQECVDRNCLQEQRLLLYSCRTPQECVDRNYYPNNEHREARLSHSTGVRG